MKKVKIDKAFALKVLSIVDKGLTYGIGEPTPGKMCVEAAVAYASGEDHNDEPSCVDYHLAQEKIYLNDQNWPNNKDRAKGLRRLAIAQLGSVNKFDNEKYETFLRAEIFPKIFAGVKEAHLRGLSTAVHLVKDASSIEDLDNLNYDEIVGEELADNFGVAGQSSYDCDDCLELLRDFTKMDEHTVLKTIAEAMVQVLIKMKIPGTKYLYLTKRKKRKATKKAKSWSPYDTIKKKAKPRWSVSVKVKSRKKKQ